MSKLNLILGIVVMLAFLAISVGETSEVSADGKGLNPREVLKGDDLLAWEALTPANKAFVEES